jgi:hypothetical protein
VRIQETTSELDARTDEANGLRSELSIVEGKIYGEKKDIERLEADHRDAANV